MQETPTSYAPDPPGTHPALDDPGYRSAARRHPREPLIRLPAGLTEITGPQLAGARIREGDHDLTAQHQGAPIGERILVRGRVLDAGGRPLRRTLVEVWQANAAGRYRHVVDQWDAPLDPNFSGAGRCLTDDDGRYEFLTVRPGAYPWRNHPNAWRPAHIHFSLLGRAFAQRLVTQMYFPGDPLFALDPIFQSVRDAAARERLVSRFDIEQTQDHWAQAFVWDVVLRGPEATPIEESH
ncbi:MAG TPA: protocatechuate 3,4-dioxygenase subunit beta [Solirubrobacteraceae bacterium]